MLESTIDNSDTNRLSFLFISSCKEIHFHCQKSCIKLNIVIYHSTISTDFKRYVVCEKSGL